MEPEADYPAAHSMDTGWFAVDRDGHIGYFYSGEAGAVPAGACSDEATDVLDRLKGVVPDTEPIYELRCRSGIREQRARHGLPPRDGVPPLFGDAPFAFLMFLESLDAVRAEIERGEAVAVPARDAVAVCFPVLSEATYQRLHDSGACLSCFNNSLTDGDLPERLGLFHYDHPDDLYIPEPYGRWGTPRRPLHVDELPDEIREMIQRARFDGVRFAEADRVQPVEYARCVTWHAVAYLKADGRSVRPIPGEEEGYRKEYKQLSEYVDLPVEPPTGSNPVEGAGDSC